MAQLRMSPAIDYCLPFLHSTLAVMTTLEWTLSSETRLVKLLHSFYHLHLSAMELFRDSFADLIVRRLTSDKHSKTKPMIWTTGDLSHHMPPAMTQTLVWAHQAPQSRIVQTQIGRRTRQLIGSHSSVTGMESTIPRIREIGQRGENFLSSSTLRFARLSCTGRPQSGLQARKRTCQSITRPRNTHRSVFPCSCKSDPLSRPAVCCGATHLILSGCKDIRIRS